MVHDIPVPDTNDWTWVLTQPCPQCGVDVQRLTSHELLDGARAYVGQYRDLLENNPDVRTRPAPGVWSPLEYAAHIKDVSKVFRTRIRAMLLHEAPEYKDWDQDAAALEGGYSGLDPRRVADSLATASGDLFRDVEALTPEEFQRTGHRSDGHVFTIETLLQYFHHELAHHWWDITARF